MTDNGIDKRILLKFRTNEALSILLEDGSEDIDEDTLSFVLSQGELQRKLVALLRSYAPPSKEAEEQIKSGKVKIDPHSDAKIDINSSAVGYVLALSSLLNLNQVQVLQVSGQHW